MCLSVIFTVNFGPSGNKLLDVVTNSDIRGGPFLRTGFTILSTKAFRWVGVGQKKLPERIGG